MFFFPLVFLIFFGNFCDVFFGYMNMDDFFTVFICFKDWQHDCSIVMIEYISRVAAVSIERIGTVAAVQK